MPHYILFSRDISLLSLVFQCYMDYNILFLFSHHTPHLQALWKVPSAQCHFTCNKLTNKLTNKPLQKISDTENLAKSLEQADLVGEFKLHTQNRVFYFARHFRWCAIIDNTNFMTCTRPHPNYNTNLPLDGVKEDTVNEDPPRTITPTRLGPMSRAPTPETTPLIEPNPTPTLVSDPAPVQNHTDQHSTPGPEPLTLVENFVHRARLDSACSGVYVASRTGPKDKGDRAPLSEQARQARRNKDRKKRQQKRQERSARGRED